jgi:hypothetical protein
VRGGRERTPGLRVEPHVGIDHAPEHAFDELIDFVARLARQCSKPSGFIQVDGGVTRD